ncbi:LysR substrate-binding domain-containing protein (plasmid) [Chimaeribacter arupi]|uniref:LysR family transcriptional regulator n=1 Tax=Chimaeribacter arupi TaxID=2060066 RepID=UPI0027121C3B|nr:LysR family transcriptional regulator [Chimaeribacter arupi]WKZ94850.1 LysR substrate-binding domain-containing protein [Chimaeribacter arupi]
MDLPALNDFNLVARHGGFGKAARATGRPKATLSRRVAELEASLGVRLFERGRTLRLTEEGRALYGRTGQLLTELEEAASAIASGGSTPRGRLRISAPLLFAQVAMGKLAAGFMRDYPGVQLEVTTEDREIDMIEEGYDLVIRVNPKEDATLIGRTFLHDRQVVVAGPRQARPAEGEPVPVVIRGPVGPPSHWEIITPQGPTPLAVTPVLSLSSMIMVRDAVRLNAGVACLPLSLVFNDLASGRLVKWGDIAGPAAALWILYPSRRLLSARVSVFLAYLKKSFPNGTSEELARFIE